MRMLRYFAKPEHRREASVLSLKHRNPICQIALDAVWESRADFRFNKGVSGRGLARFSKTQLARLERQIAFYPNLVEMKGRLIPSSAS